MDFYVEKKIVPTCKQCLQILCKNKKIVLGGEVALKDTAQEIFAILQYVTASTSNLLLTSSPELLVRSHQLSEQNIPEE